MPKRWRLTAGILVFAALSPVPAAPAAAQVWGVEYYDEHGVFAGYLSHENTPLVLSCGGVYPGGEAIYFEGTGINNPYVLTVGIDGSGLLGNVFDSNGVTGRSDFVVDTGGLGFGLPFAYYNEMLGDFFLAEISAGDQMIGTLLQGGPVRVLAGSTELSRDDGAGLAQAMTDLLLYCDLHWTALGQAVPGHASGLIAALRASTGAVAATEQVALPAATDQALRSGCGGPYTLDPAALGVADFDGDGGQDYVIGGYGISCQNGINPYCGASSCSIDVYMAFDPSVPSGGFIGTSYSIATAPDGGPGIQLPIPGSPVRVWTGSGFRP